MTRIIIVVLLGAFICGANYETNLRPYLKGKDINYYIQAMLLILWGMVLAMVLIPYSQFMREVTVMLAGQ